jgi:hypothetical protein
MVTKQAVEEQLKRIGCNFRFWGRAEVNELGRILMDDEIIAECVNGQYTNGFALLVATNHRVLLVDKKPLLYLTVEDVRFEMITEFSYNHRLLDATIKIFTTNKTLLFTSWNQHRLRRLLEYTQAHVLEMRQQQHLAQQFQAAAAAQYAQLHAAQTPAQFAVPAPNYTPNLAPPQEVPQQQFAPAATSEAPALPQPQTAQVHSDATPSNSDSSTSNSRFANRRATLGTYTRSKLPSFHLRPFDQQPAAPNAESGEVYQSGYTPQPTLRLPYEYEG